MWLNKLSCCVIIHVYTILNRGAHTLLDLTLQAKLKRITHRRKKFSAPQKSNLGTWSTAHPPAPRLLSSHLHGHFTPLYVKWLRTSNRLSPFQDLCGDCPCLCPTFEPQQGWGRGQDGFFLAWLPSFRNQSVMFGQCCDTDTLNLAIFSLATSTKVLSEMAEIPPEFQANAQTQNVNEWDKQKHFRISKSDAEWLSAQSWHQESSKPDPGDVGTSPVWYAEVCASLCSLLVTFWLEY